MYHNTQITTLQLLLPLLQFKLKILFSLSTNVIVLGKGGPFRHFWTFSFVTLASFYSEKKTYYSHFEMWLTRDNNGVFGKNFIVHGEKCVLRKVYSAEIFCVLVMWHFNVYLIAS